MKEDQGNEVVPGGEYRIKRRISQMGEMTRCLHDGGNDPAKEKLKIFCQ